MSSLQISKNKMSEGVWHGIVTGADTGGTTAPRIEVSHENTPVKDIELIHDTRADHWKLSVPIPAQAIADGVQTLIIRDAAKDEKIGHITIMAGEELGEDLRAEVNLLRAELDMLKSAFRRHCVETT